MPPLYPPPTFMITYAIFLYNLVRDSLFVTAVDGDKIIEKPSEILCEIEQKLSKIDNIRAYHSSYHPTTSAIVYPGRSSVIFQVLKLVEVSAPEKLYSECIVSLGLPEK